MANFLELVTGLQGQTETDDSPEHEFPSSEYDNFFADRDTAGSAHHQPSLPSFPEGFGGANDCQRQSFFPSSLCPLYGGDFLQQPQCHQTELQVPLPPSSPANNVPRALAHGVTDLTPLHLGNSYNRNNNDNPCQTRISETPALLQWTDGVLADGSFACLLPEAPLPHSQDPRQCQYQQHQQQQHQHQSFGDYQVVNNPHPFIPSLGGLELYLNLHHTSHSHSHCTTTQQRPPSTTQQPTSTIQQQASTSEVPLPLPLPRPVFSPTTTAPSTARPDHEPTPFSNYAPPFSTPEHLRLFPPVPPILGGDQSADTPQPQIPGADFDDHFSAPYGNDDDPFLYWHSPMTSAFGFNSDSFDPEAAMPSLANPSSTRRRSSRRLSNSVVDLTKEESRDNITSSSPVPMAPPPTRKRRRSTTAGSGTSASNTRRTSASQASKAIKTEAKRPGSRGGDTGVFGSSPPPAFHGDEDVLDLTEANEGSVAQKKIEADRRVKLSKFQCVICMDDVSNLTVTHCGHLFCSECLHSALHIDSTKRSCPVCRSKVDLRSKTGKNTKSFYHLELKVMTATRKGKQPAAASR